MEGSQSSVVTIHDDEWDADNAVVDNCGTIPQMEEDSNDGFPATGTLTEPGPNAVGRHYHCYCLRSCDPKHPYKTYVGFTTDPRRRIRQHNGTLKHGGARRTRRSGRPWEFVVIVHGFPTQKNALRFEWAWQHCDRSLAVRAVIGDAAAQALKRKARGPSGQLRILKTLLLLRPDLTPTQDVDNDDVEVEMATRGEREPPLEGGHLTLFFLDAKFQSMYEKIQLADASALVSSSLEAPNSDLFLGLPSWPMQLVASLEEMPVYPPRNKTLTKRRKNLPCHQEEHDKSTTASKRLSKKKAVEQRSAIDPKSSCKISLRGTQQPSIKNTNRTTHATTSVTATAKCQPYTTGSSMDAIYQRYLTSQVEFDSSSSSSSEGEDSAVSGLTSSMNDVKISSLDVKNQGRKCFEPTMDDNATKRNVGSEDDMVVFSKRIGKSSRSSKVAKSKKISSEQDWSRNVDGIEQLPGSNRKATSPLTEDDAPTRRWLASDGFSSDQSNQSLSFPPVASKSRPHDVTKRDVAVDSSDVSDTDFTVSSLDDDHDDDDSDCKMAVVRTPPSHRAVETGRTDAKTAGTRNTFALNLVVDLCSP